MLMWRGCGCWLKGKIFVKLVKNQAVISQFTASNLDSCRYVVGNFLGCYGYFLSQLKKTFVGAGSFGGWKSSKWRFGNWLLFVDSC